MSADKFDAEYAALHLQAAQMALDSADQDAGDMLACGRWRLLAECAINRAHLLLTGNNIVDAIIGDNTPENEGGAA